MTTALETLRKAGREDSIFVPVTAPCCKRRMPMGLLKNVRSHPGFDDIVLACGNCITNAERSFVVAAQNIESEKPQLDVKWDSQKASLVRAERNRLLAACDWVVVPDSPISNQAAWRTYRQALRNIPQTFSSPDEVTWPVQPVKDSNK